MQKRRNTKVIAANASYPQDDSDPLSRNLTPGGPFTCVAYQDWAKGPVQRALDQIRLLCDKNRMQEAVGVAGELGRDSCAIEPKLIVDFDPLMSRMIIRSTQPDLTWDIAPLEPLIDKLWRVVKDSANPAYYFAVKPWIYRWYEHQGHHKEAFLIQKQFLKFFVRQKDKRREAEMLNDMGYEHLCLEEWKKGIGLFRKSARIFRGLGMTESYANARANYWVSRFLGDSMTAAGISQLERELPDLSATLGNSYYKRQPFMLNARMAEWRGDVDRAIHFAEKAVLAGPQGTKYPETDRAYIEGLKKKGRAT